jgi:rubrerythrin
MNKARRKRLEDALETLREIAREERDAFENLPESLQHSARGEQMELIADTVEAAADDIESDLSA